jgi:Holliday junction resolvase RusA-like endonuclease
MPIETATGGFEIDIKPLSVNKAWQGRRFKTKEYKDFEEQLLWKLKGIKPVSGKYALHIDFYFKNYKMADLSNCLKTTEDIIVKAGLVEDDRFCYEIYLRKFGGEDKIIFWIESLSKNTEPAPTATE